MSPPPRLVDLHEDVALYYYSGSGYGYDADSFERDLSSRQADLPKYKRANVKLVFSSVFPLMRTLNPEIAQLLQQGYGGLNSAFAAAPGAQIAQELMRIYYEMERKHGGALRLVEDARDLDDILSTDKVGFLISLEGTESVADPSSVEVLWRLGVRSVQLTWNFDTKYASSCMSETDYGLTGAGKTLVRKLNEMGVIVDLAHSGKKTCIDTLEASELPVMISHANCASVYKHKRNVDNEVLEALRSNGGVIGITMIPDTFGKPKPDMNDVVEHIRYIKDNFGSKILAIGTDYFGLFPPDVPPNGLEDISKFLDLWNALGESGLDAKEIEAISSENAMRLVRKNMERWHS